MAHGLDHGALLNRAAAFVAARRTLAARPLLATLRRANVAPAEVAMLEARLQADCGNPDAALLTLDAAIAAQPEAEAGRLYHSRADLRSRAGQTTHALHDAAEAVVRMPRDVPARGLLGMLLLQTEQLADATTVLRGVWADAPGHPGVRQGLALAREIGRDIEGAADLLADAIADAPADPRHRGALMLLWVRHDEPAKALAVGEAAQAAQCVDACVLGLLGHAHSMLGAHARAAAVFKDALALGPQDDYVRHLAATADASYAMAQDRAPQAYVRAVFDGYADRFEAHILSLGYRAPGRLRSMLLAHVMLPAAVAAEVARTRSDDPGRVNALGPVLDLGCGTGLMAIALSDLPVGPFTGVDLSGEMLARARERGLYERLHLSDLQTVLDGADAGDPVADVGGAEDGRFAAVLAADVFCYLGTLTPVLRGIARRLQPGGLLLFTTEAAAAGAVTGAIAGARAGAQAAADTGPGERGWRLLGSGRYAHTEAYLRAELEAAGFAPLELVREVLREDAGRTVEGYFVAATPRAAT